MTEKNKCIQKDGIIGLDVELNERKKTSKYVKIWFKI
jgi:hypothetical protein